MKKSDEQQEIRERLRKNLDEIVGNYKNIIEIMASLPHSGGIAHRSLNPRSGEYISKGENSFSSTYKDKNDGQIYFISIYTEKDEKKNTI